jgi:hypothetical protein
MGSTLRYATVATLYKSNYEGSPLTVTFKGSRDSAPKITAILSAEEFGIDGEFTAIQSK